ncbi:MAG: toll/interleukin-1 receptor domain-containing protein, partial [Bacteroidota bacterium]
ILSLMSQKIIINYRKHDSPCNSAALHQELINYFSKEAVRKDEPAIAMENDFGERIENSLEACDVLLVLIGENWLTMQDENGNVKIFSADDFVRLQIAAALKKNISVIPVLFDNTPLPKAKELPEDLKKLSELKHIDINTSRFEADTIWLVQMIKYAIHSKAASKTIKPATPIKPVQVINDTEKKPVIVAPATVENPKLMLKSNETKLEIKPAIVQPALVGLPKPILEPTKTKDSKKVFISYHGEDIKVAERLKNRLTDEKIAVLIDCECMNAGEDIKEFIEKCIRQTRITISIISEGSLLSSWVAMESINTFYQEETDGQKKFLACYITDEFLNINFTNNALDQIEKQIKEIKIRIANRMEKDRGFRDLQNELSRLWELRNNMDEIIRRLRESLCIDIREENFDANFSKILEAIQS